MFHSKYLTAAQTIGLPSRLDTLYVYNSLYEKMQCMQFLGIQIILYLQLIVDRASMTSGILSQ
jgi:hypothetical protein